MPPIDVVVETKISNSVRAAQVSSMFDVPPQKKQRQEWHGELPLETRDWNVGLIVGPSGCGKSTILRYLFGETPALEWRGASVIDDFAKHHSVQDIAAICQSVGFNTIPAWLRPFAVLSNGERFRVEMARRMLESAREKTVLTMDEFTSVVDRQVAQIGSHAVQKWIRKNKQQFVAATCHYDLEEWLQPDWILEPATMTFRWRSVQRRPEMQCSVFRVEYEAWRIFSRFHYMSAELNHGAKCFMLSIADKPAAFCAVVHRPHAKISGLFGMSRLVTLPDFQGLGLAFILADRVASAYRALDRRYRAYPAHPSLVRAFDKSSVWALIHEGAAKSARRGQSSSVANAGRPCAVFEYCGPAMERFIAEKLIL